MTKFRGTVVLLLLIAGTNAHFGGSIDANVDFNALFGGPTPPTTPSTPTTPSCEFAVESIG